MGLSLPLSNIVPVSVVVSASAVPGQSFNQGLIVGPSAVIPSVGNNSRIRQYTSLTGMLQDGFLTTSPEYIAMSLYFGQTPAPSAGWVGRQDLTAIQTLIPHAGNLGTGYVNGDIVSVVQAGGSLGTAKVVSTVSGAVALETTTGTASSGSTALTVASGTGIAVGQGVVGAGIALGTTVAAVAGTAVTLSLPTTAALSSTAVTFSGLLLVTGGTGYAVATGLTTTGGTGTGLEVDIIAIGETPLQAVTACRAAQTAWYACTFVGTAQDSDHLAIAGYIEAATPYSTYFLTSGEAAVLNNTANNLFALLQTAGYKRTFMLYSTTQSGAFPNNVYASAAVMGMAMGLNTGAAGSYFTLAYKAIAGVGAEPLTQTQVTTICGSANRTSSGLNGNIVANYNNGAYPALLQYGTMSNGGFFDQVMFLDMLANDIQTSGFNLLTSVPSIPITNAGVIQVANVVGSACSRSKALGFIAPSGVWNGGTVGTGSNAVNPGDALSNGYFIYTPPVSSLSAGQRAARQLPALTVLLIEAEAGQSLAVTVDVQQ